MQTSRSPSASHVVCSSLAFSYKLSCRVVSFRLAKGSKLLLPPVRTWLGHTVGSRGVECHSWSLLGLLQASALARLLALITYGGLSSSLGFVSSSVRCHVDVFAILCGTRRGTCVGSSSLDSVHETRHDRAVSQDSAKAALPVPQFFWFPPRRSTHKGI